MIITPSPRTGESMVGAISVDVPFIEVHATNIHKRETFRHHSYLSGKAEAVICGLGMYRYTAAIEYAVKHLKPKSKAEL